MEQDTDKIILNHPWTVSFPLAFVNIKNFNVMWSSATVTMVTRKLEKKNTEMTLNQREMTHDKRHRPVPPVIGCLYKQTVAEKKLFSFIFYE